MLIGRAYGVLLHVTSLPSPYGVGDFGPEAYRFVDFLVEAGSGYWQVLPLVPTSEAYGNSPYASDSSFALNPLLVSPDLLVEEGLLPKAFPEQIRLPPHTRADYPKAYGVKEKALRKAYESFLEKRDEYRRCLEEFVARNEYWLRDYALFVALREKYGSPWTRWPRELRERRPSALREAEKELAGIVDYVVFQQFVAEKQWMRLKAYAGQRGVKIIGDIPYYVMHDSADVWANQELFKLDEKGEPLYVSGVPPDYFSKTGQLWGTPVYNWEKHREQGFKWWLSRIGRSLELYDLVRLDHFRGFLAYWEVLAGSKTAAKGRWVRTPYEDFFRAVVSRYPTLPFIAEDLGFITPDVREVMRRLGLPGMRVLVFAFGGSPFNEHLPHNYEQNLAVYTSTHDTNTAKGWYTEEARPVNKLFLRRYAGVRVTRENVHRILIRMAMSSIAALAVIPVQDVLGLGKEARMNRPGTARGNWEWRLLPNQLKEEHAKWLRELASLYARTGA
ncbi:4-alpha-glucanotransferase [Pyrofollis japonicus]|uniref:4-alpha-glucanotransferase n=1 Tax=Pyrofollis japonicus TaxID=3060460 RepID=UPI00295B92BD|nr:4-alpha-glucanotransferase [Pyrofollis japonicus]BEP17237.1 4-alpha-glucanotransferase [Pyrofollis japonicus]